MPSIDLSKSTYGRLLQRSMSFEDTPDVVIRRLLDETDGERSGGHRSSGDNPASNRAAPGSILPEREYWLPILAVLDAKGGGAPATEVIDALEEQLQMLLKPLDREQLPMGEIRWRNRARFARLKMRERGLLRDDSHRGIWEISDAGREYLAVNSGGRR